MQENSEGSDDGESSALIDSGAESSEPFALNDETNAIIHMYGKIHKILFSYGLYILVSIISVIVVTSSLSDLYMVQAKSLDINPDVINRRNSLSVAPDVMMVIEKWPIWYEDGVFRTANNLLSYQWYVLPQYSILDADDVLPPIELFEADGYAVEELLQWMNAAIFIDETQKQEIDTFDLTSVNAPTVKEFFRLNLCW